MARFKVLTYNVFKLGGLVAPETVIERVLELEPDVVGFQEVFNTRFPIGIRARNAKRLLEQHLSSRGYETVWEPASGPGPWLFGKFRDGILTAIDKSRWEFDRRQGYFSEVLSRNGFASRKIQGLLARETETGRRVAFFNTHLSVGTTDLVRERRKREIEKAVAFIDRIEQEHRPVASILVGDFNAVKGEIGRLLLDVASDARFQDTWAEMNGGEPPKSGNTIDLDNTLVKARKKKPRESMRIDYVFLRPHPGERAVGEALVEPVRSEVRLREKVEVIDPAGTREENLSDHYGVVTELGLK